MYMHIEQLRSSCESESACGCESAGLGCGCGGDIEWVVVEGSGIRCVGSECACDALCCDKVERWGDGGWRWSDCDVECSCAQLRMLVNGMCICKYERHKLFVSIDIL